MQKDPVYSKFQYEPLAESKLALVQEVVFAIQPRNLDVLEKKFWEVSDPDSPSYGNYLTYEEIKSLTSNYRSSDIVSSFLKKSRATILNRTPNDEFLTAIAPLSTWANIFSTTFYEVTHPTLTSPQYQNLVRAKEINIPVALRDHLAGVFNIVDLPPEIYTKKGKQTAIPNLENLVQDRADGVFVNGMVTPALLNKHYSINPTLGNTKTTQGAFETGDQWLSLADLKSFQQYFQLPVQSIAKSVGGNVMSGPCTSLDSCVEANLDFQYIMSVAQNVPTASLYFPGDWLSFIQNISSWKQPTNVVSISWASYETQMTPEYIKLFNTAAMKLGLMGVTVVAASGDHGVSGFFYDFTQICMYGPMFPASSPYVLSVGGTMGPELGTAEIVCQADKGGDITSGGGFSFYSSTPDYQKSFVNQYVANHPKQLPGFNPAGRGYPDVSALAQSYMVNLGGTFYQVSGTSASAPVVAGMISLINAQRVAKGASLLGFVNPYLYKNAPAMIKDITVGDNSCGDIYFPEWGYVRCPQGFHAAKGWDPVSGVGVFNFTNFYNIAVPKTKNPGYVENPSTAGMVAGTIFFVFAIVIMAAVAAWSIKNKKHSDTDHQNYEMVDQENPIYPPEDDDIAK